MSRRGSGCQAEMFAFPSEATRRQLRKFSGGREEPGRESGAPEGSSQDHGTATESKDAAERGPVRKASWLPVPFCSHDFPRDGENSRAVRPKWNRRWCLPRMGSVSISRVFPGPARALL